MNCLPVLAISCRFWLKKFQIGEMGAELPAMMPCHRHICNPRVCAKCNLRQKNFTFWSYLRQQYVTVSLPLVKACFLSHQWDNLYLHDTLIALLLLTQPPPIAALHHGKTARSGERCLILHGIVLSRCSNAQDTESLISIMLCTDSFHRICTHWISLTVLGR